ncbi:DHA2 family efflux MFS transporter permease subunit [Microvirga tunisiensis]|uniref:DHA2 family efflux MFS transporter permease subunit n=1 Tax=Microvirga tunisiensis TaxID=2108360 RepID=A0A5N7MJQ7_9HYPH|nr:DHA2 family efflux MFS transporter permease subunit [Microvirga tunisiensis]MPR08898.1 DHA2 family efflux MFS transporter permease subunit [Microvirga tunisiensis]MPR27058.1 DHA2 family efflux MFS transporter permease subunit [Microvirga tunisiensis]
MRQSRFLPLIIATALFMENTDSTVISTSLPMIAQSLGTDPIALKLALTSYLVSLAIFIPISGWMADKYGARTIFTTAIGVFMAGSLACAGANSLEWFVIARFVQGAGGAMMVPVGRLVLLRSVQRSEVVQALATLTIPALVGPIVGPPLGGFITTYFDWRWIFFINIPIGVLGIVLATIFVPNVREEDTPPLDFIGFVLSGFGFALLMLGFASGGRHLIPAEISTGCVVIGAICLVLYVFHARRTPYPVLQLRLLKIPTFRISVVGGFLFRVGIGAIPFLLPLMLQVGFGLSPLASGSLTFIAAVGALFMKTMAKRILERTGFRRLLIVNAFIGAGFVAANGFFTPETPHWLIMIVLLVGGCFRSLQFTSLNAIGYAEISNREMSYATSLSSALQQVSLSIGVAFGAFVLEVAASLDGNPVITAADFGPAFWAVAMVSALAGFVFIGLSPTAGAEMSGHRIVKEKPPSTGLGDGMSGR